MSFITSTCLKLNVFPEVSISCATSSVIPIALSGRSARAISTSWVKPCATVAGVTGTRPTGPYGQLRPLSGSSGSGGGNIRVTADPAPLGLINLWIRIASSQLI
eukprot:1490979-Amphidinium_carterae.1